MGNFIDYDSTGQPIHEQSSLIQDHPSTNLQVLQTHFQPTQPLFPNNMQPSFSQQISMKIAHNRVITPAQHQIALTNITYINSKNRMTSVREEEEEKQMNSKHD